MKRKLLFAIVALLCSVGTWADGYTDYLNAANGWTQVTNASGISTDGSAVYVIASKDDNTRVASIADENSTAQLTTTQITSQPTRNQVWFIELDSYDGNDGYAMKNLARADYYFTAGSMAWDQNASASSKGVAGTCYTLNFDGNGDLTIQTNSKVGSDNVDRYWGWWNYSNPSASSNNLAGNKAAAQKMTFQLFKKVIAVDGQDVSFLIGNRNIINSNKSNMPTCWTALVHENTNGNCTQGTGDTQLEGYLGNGQSSFSIDYYQTISNLPAGYYAVTAKVHDRKGRGGYLYIYSNSTGSAVKNKATMPNSTADKYFDVTTSPIQVAEGGSINIGIGGDNLADTWVTGDDFRLTYLGASLPTQAEPWDLTACIANSGFEVGEIGGWTNSGTKSLGTQSNGDFSGKQDTYYAEVWHQAGTFDINQTLSSLPAGLYKLTAIARGEMGDAVLYANDIEVPLVKNQTSTYGVYINLLNAGNIKIGVKGTETNSTWICVDDFHLTYYGTTFSQNLAFDEDVQFGTSANDNWSTADAVRSFSGWNLYQKGDYSAGGVFAYGTSATINGTAIPATAPSSSSSTAGLAMTAGWQNYIAYRSPLITLAAGTYTFSYKAYNANTRSEKVDNYSQMTTVLENLTGFVTAAGTTYHAATTNFAKGAWNYEEITFTLTEETTGYLQVGYRGANVPSTACPILVFDGLSIAPASATNNVAEGQYYLYNVGADKYLQGGNAYGTFASLREVGLLCTLTAGSSSGTYKIQSGLNDNSGNTAYLGSNGYVDNGTAADWTFEEISEGVYKLKNGGNYLYWGGSGTALTLDSTEPTTNNGYWTLVKKANRQDDVSSATHSSAKDASFLIANPDFDRNHPGGWAKSNATLAQGNNDGYVGEFFNNNGSVTQTITNLPVGAYLVKVNGYYRNGTTFDQNLYMNVGDKSLVMPNILHEAKGDNSTAGFDYELATGKFVPNTGGHASIAFENGAFQRVMPVIVTGTSLALGLSENVTNTNDWSAFDRVRLVYYGNTAESYAAVLSQLQAQATADLADAFFTNVKGSERNVLTAQSTASASTVDEYNTRFGTVSSAINNFERAKQAYDNLKAYLDEMYTYVGNENYPTNNDDFETAYNTANNIYTTSTTLMVSSFATDITNALDAALSTLLAANGGSLAEPINMTAKIQNPDMAAVTGWMLDGMSQQSSQFGNVSTTPIIEKYGGSASTAISAASSCKQTLSNMRAGHYYLRAAVNATLQSAASPSESGVTGVNLLLGSASTAVHATENAAGEIYRVDYDLKEAGDLLIGFETTAGCTANWVAWDNVELYYCGPSDTYATDLAAAVAANKSEFSAGVVKNFTFDDVTGWTGGTHQPSMPRGWKDGSTNDAFIERTATGVIYYTFPNMPAGNYKVVAAVRGFTGGRMTLSVANTKGTSIIGVGDAYVAGNSEINMNGVEMPNRVGATNGFTTNANGHNWRWATATGTLASAGDLTVVFSTFGNGWQAIDDVTLYYLGDDEVVSYTKDAASVSNSGKTVTKDIVVSNPNAIISSDEAIAGAAGVQINNNLVSGTIANLVLYDGNSYTSPAGEYAATTAKLYRSIAASAKATVIVPFALDATTISKGRAYQLRSYANDNVSFKSIDNPAADKPFVFVTTEAVSELTGTRASAAAGDNQVEGTNATLYGTYVNTLITPNANNYVASGGMLWLVDNELNSAPFRAYLNIENPTSVKALSFDFDNATGINTIANSQQPMANGPIYNLAGQKMSKFQKGVNIVNGKKVLVK